MQWADAEELSLFLRQVKWVESRDDKNTILSRQTGVLWYRLIFFYFFPLNLSNKSRKLTRFCSVGYIMDSGKICFLTYIIWSLNTSRFYEPLLWGQWYKGFKGHGQTCPVCKIVSAFILHNPQITETLYLKGWLICLFGKPLLIFGL